MVIYHFYLCCAGVSFGSFLVANMLQDGVQPMWEDQANKKGGKWMVQLPRQQRSSELDKIWLETVASKF